MTNDWETEFDRNFVGSKSGFGDWLTPKSGMFLKKFIYSLLLSHEQKRNAELKEKINKVDTVLYVENMKAHLRFYIEEHDLVKRSDILKSLDQPKKE